MGPANDAEAWDDNVNYHVGEGIPRVSLERVGEAPYCRVGSCRTVDVTMPVRAAQASEPSPEIPSGSPERPRLLLTRKSGAALQLACRHPQSNLRRSSPLATGRETARLSDAFGRPARLLAERASTLPRPTSISP
jgi:hypothetical protein